MHHPSAPLPALRAALVALVCASFLACGSDSRPKPADQLAMHREFALRYFDSGDVDRAEQQVDKGLEIASRDKQLLLMKAWIRQRRGTTPDILIAEKIFRDLSTGDDYRVDLGLGEALERKGVLYQEAADAVGRGERYTESKDPKARATELAGDARSTWEQALVAYQRALERKPGEFQAMNGLQRVLALQGNYAGSLKWADAILEGSAKEVSFWREQLDRPELTVNEDKRLRALLSGSTRLQVETHLSAATLLMQLGRKNEALAHLDSVALADPERAEVHSRRAQLLFEAKRYPEAAQAIQDYLRLCSLPFDHPDVRRAYSLLSECESAARRGSNEPAPSGS